ncbi:MAG: hemolysin family protein, partial [Chthoniobacterales bacterium]
MEFTHLLLAAAASGEITTDWDSPGVIFIKLLAILALVLLNGFFVASEFAIVKVRGSQIDTLIDAGATKNATRARLVVDHLDEYLSATQLGITLASLGLGWIGEPFLAAMLEPIFHKVGITSAVAIHTAGFALAFSIITYLHIVLGELTPKSLAIRRALNITILISAPLRLFYLVFKPFIWFLNGNANYLLRHIFKVEPAGESELAHSEEELRLILAESQKSDEVTSLGREIVINALDLKRRIVRDIMTPRGEVIYLDLDEPFDVEMKTAMESRHTRFPLCREHLDDAVGLVHIKDLLALVREKREDLTSIKR